MRTQKLALSGLILGLSLGGIALTGSGCAGSTFHRSTGTYLDDKGVATRVKTALFRDPLVSGFDVHVNSFRGDVQLSGFVDSEQQKQRAAEIARRVEGVREVVNNVEVKPGTTAVGTPGSGVQGASRTEIQPAPVTPPPDNAGANHLAPVRSESDISTPGTAVLPTANSSQYNELGQPAAPAARSASSLNSNDTSANNDLALAGTPSNTSLPENLQIQVSDGRATIRGTVSSDEQRQDIERRVKDIPGVRSVDNQLDVRVPSNR